ncbi:hypothetical protein [Nocardia sp. NPDC050435]|uniref:hypothetical protein n=1 Tax=Nocardia sp. NPDC050435 TaxID=3155040 RepID=UPI0033D30EF6
MISDRNPQREALRTELFGLIEDTDPAEMSVHWDRIRDAGYRVAGIATWSTQSCQTLAEVATEVAGAETDPRLITAAQRVAVIAAELTPFATH